MNNIRDIGDNALNRLENEVRDTLMEYQLFCTKDAVTYKRFIPSLEQVKFTYTLLYITSSLTSALAKLYMLFGYTKGELDSEELREHLTDIDNSMCSKTTENMYLLHAKLRDFIDKGEELNIRVNAISKGVLK